MKSNISKRDQMLLMVKDLVLETMQDVPVNIYLFGSWARNEEKRTSDIDVAFDSQKKISIKKWVELRDKIDESTIPYHVDLVDLQNTNSDLIMKVKREGILWKDYKKDSKAQIEP
ncbi:nucleotidyltransferase family protein [Oceanobacillus longus]|uniref:Nucleotidyltransferase family protein n=1 Tax=Oceanobacillus longus TaxID=930120 RepID=A0ABV8GV75_9BACI